MPQPAELIVTTEQVELVSVTGRLDDAGARYLAVDLSRR